MRHHSRGLAGDRLDLFLGAAYLEELVAGVLAQPMKHETPLSDRALGFSLHFPRPHGVEVVGRELLPIRLGY